MRISDWSSDVCSSDLGRLSMPLLRRLAGVAVALACLWSAAAPAAETVRVGVLKYGTVNWEISIIQRHEMDVQHGFHLEVLELASDQDRKSTRLNSSHYCASRMPSSA